MIWGDLTVILSKFVVSGEFQGTSFRFPLLNSETSEAYGSTQTGVAFTADTQ